MSIKSDNAVRFHFELILNEKIMTNLEDLNNLIYAIDEKITINYPILIKEKIFFCIIYLFILLIKRLIPTVEITWNENRPCTIELLVFLETK